MLRQLITTSKRNFTISQQLSQNIKQYSPSNLDKKFLVWSGKYKSLGEVPMHVSYEVMERCRNKIRIRIANIMIGLTIVGCGIMVYSGKQAAKRGDSVFKQNIDWHKKYNEDEAKKQEQAAVAAAAPPK